MSIDRLGCHLLDFDVGFDVDAGNDENTISLQQNFIIGVEKSSGQLKCLEWLPYLDSSLRRPYLCIDVMLGYDPLAGG